MLAMDGRQTFYWSEDKDKEENELHNHMNYRTDKKETIIAARKVHACEGISY
jgi:hypothetical protein